MSIITIGCMAYMVIMFAVSFITLSYFTELWGGDPLSEMFPGILVMFILPVLVGILAQVSYMKQPGVHVRETWGFDHYFTVAVVVVALFALNSMFLGFYGFIMGL